MAHYEESKNSLPYIDDTLTDDDISEDKCRYNLKIIENYNNKGRNIEITNSRFDNIFATSLNSVAPLAEETEVSDSLEDENLEGKENFLARPTALKLVIKGCNSTISIQGLDNKSSIIFRRKSERVRREKSAAVEHRKESCRKNSLKQVEAMKSSDKPKKGRWKMLTKSLISKSSRFERKTSVERYPKYVLLKNEVEEEEHLVKKKPNESYPKMVIFNSKTSRKIENVTNEKKKYNTDKSEFSLKKSFKNKTEPIAPLEQLLTKSFKSFDKQSKKEQEKNLREKRYKTFRKTVIEDEKGLQQLSLQGNEQEVVVGLANQAVFQGSLFNEIQGILEEALNLYSDVKAPNSTKEPEQPPPEEPQQCFSSVPPQICQNSCHDSHCYQPPMYIPVYNQYVKPTHSYRSFYTQTNQNDFGTSNQSNANLEFGILSSFFPGAVVMKTYQCGNLDKKIEDVDAPEEKIVEISKTFAADENDIQTLKVPVPDLSIKSKMILKEEKQDQKPEESRSFDFQPEECSVQHQNSDYSDEKETTKVNDSEATEYLFYNESESQENESTTTTTWTINKTEKEDEDEKKRDDSFQNLSLTKAGYKMYDSLTKLSLSCEENRLEKPEEKECDTVVKPTKQASFNISVDSNSGMIQVVVPEDTLTFGFTNSVKSDIQIGFSQSKVREIAEGKKIVEKSELWHPDNGRKISDLSIVKKEKLQNDREDGKDSQRIKLSVGDNKEVVLSIEMGKEKSEKKKLMEKTTKEMKIGTDDIDLAGGDLLHTKGCNYQNLSPRTGQILKSLEEKLAFSDRERLLLAEKIKKKLEEEILERTMFPGLFLVKQISPRPCTPKKPSQVSCLKKPKKVTEKDELNKLREYYCEECLATMRIFEDENPSVKSMVDKFETIIQLDKY